jgi:hypothetical protein
MRAAAKLPHTHDRGTPLIKPVKTLGNEGETNASTMQMPPFSGHAQEDFMRFIEGELTIADDFLGDAVVHLQLHHFFLAIESLQDASQTMNIVERYLPGVAETHSLLQYQSNVSAARERVRLLEQSITVEGKSQASDPRSVSIPSA